MADNSRARIITNPHYGNAVVGVLEHVAHDTGRISVRLLTDEDASAAWWSGVVRQNWIADAMILVDREVVVYDGCIYRKCEV